jgi:rhamnose utilization protein RhaD (predicted bifunctional aldolase and dehydrogenase)
MSDGKLRWIAEFIDYEGGYGTDEVGEMFGSIEDAVAALRSYRDHGDVWQQSHILPDGSTESSFMPGVSEHAELRLYRLGREWTIAELQSTLHVPALALYGENGPDRVIRIGTRGATRAHRA